MILYDVSCSIALRIGRATPELPAGVDPLLCHTLDHGFASQGTERGLVLLALLGTIGKTFGGQRLCKTAFHLKG